MARRPKILFVAMHTSIHAARWIEQASQLGFECHLFPLDPEQPNHRLTNVTLHVPTLNNAPLSSRLHHSIRSNFLRAARLLKRSLSDPLKAMQRLRELLLATASATHADKRLPDGQNALLNINPFAVDDVLRDLANPEERVRLDRSGETEHTTLRLYGPEVLAALIEDLKPDLIHSMEFQRAGYLVLSCRDHVRSFPLWLATNWGSDIYYFRTIPEHVSQIRRLCEAIDLYSCECHRDLALGREFGYRGPDLPVLPNSGGMDIDNILALRSQVLPSARKLIMVKGYDHFAGRAMTSLAVLERFAEQLHDYTIVLFSVGARPRSRAAELVASGKLNIKVIGWATHDDILRHFGLARIYLGVSISDGISTSVLEAMAMGAFPIQTNTSCCAEWFIDEETGYAVEPDDFEAICDRFQNALLNDSLVDDAAKRNLDIVKSRLATEAFLPRMHDFYVQAMAHTRSDGNSGAGTPQ